MHHTPAATVLINKNKMWPVIAKMLCIPHVDYEETWWQRTLLSKSNTNGKQLRFNTTDTNLRTRIQWLDGTLDTWGCTDVSAYCKCREESVLFWCSALYAIVFARIESITLWFKHWVTLIAILHHQQTKSFPSTYPSSRWSYSCFE